MGENDAFLTNFIYRSPICFSRDFSYRFLSSIYHFLVRDSQKKSNERFDEIINDETIKNLDINKKLLIPALQRHTLALININREIFERNDEEIIENYIQEIYPEKFEGYKNFLRGLDYERTGLKNVLNVQQLYEQEHQNTLEKVLSIEEIDMLNEYSDFEIQMESTNNFFYICENLRSKLIPSFYSPTDYKEIKMDHFNKGAFLIRRKEVNQLKNNNTIGGEIVWKSGKFNFEIEKKTKSGWFFGKKKSNEENKEQEQLKEIEIELIKEEANRALFEEANKEMIKMQEANELANENLKEMKKELSKNYGLKNEDIQKLIGKVNKENKEYINKEQQGRLGEYIETSDFFKQQEEQLLAMRKLANKGKEMKLYEIDELVQKYGNTEIIKAFVDSLLNKLSPPEKEVKLFKDEDEINIIKEKEEKKLA
tara:strand:+ start:217 stop:1491 length:1275 start_codon:yes stop_codon:yes gene_type:complete